MDYLEKQKNYRLPENSLYSENSPFRWKGEFRGTLEFFRTVSCFPTSSSYFKIYSFDEDLMPILEDWDLETLSNSVLFYYLENTIHYNQIASLPFISKAVWGNISTLILNPAISQSTINLVEQLDLKKVSPKEIIIGGVSNAMTDIIVFENNVCAPDGLKSLLLFLDIDLVSVDLLVNKAFKDKTLKDVIAFLHTIETGNYERCVFTESLQLYKTTQFLKAGNDVRDINNSINFYVTELSQIERSELEFLDVFDMFESSETVKSKSSTIILYSFYEDLVKNILLEQKSEILELFQLFEESLSTSQEKTSLLTDTSLENSKILVNRFLVNKKPEIENWLEKNKKGLKRFLKETHLFDFILMAILVCCVILKYSSNSKQPLPQNGAQIVHQAPFASLSQRHISKMGKQTTYFSPEPSVSLLSGKAAQNQRSRVYRENHLVVFQQSPVSGNHSRNARLNSKHLQNNYPASIITVNVGELTGNSTKTPVNLLTTVGQFGEGQNIKNAQTSYLGKNSSSIVAQRASIDREHVLINPLLKALNIKRENGYCHFFLTSHHNIHTQLMKKNGFLWTLQYGYVQNKNTLCDLVNAFSTTYTDNLKLMYSSTPPADCMIVVNNKNIKPVDDLTRYGTDQQAVIVAGETGYKMENGRLKKMHIPENLLIRYLHNNMLNQKVTEDFSEFLTVCCPVHGDFDPRVASKVLENGLEKGQYIVTHYKTIEPLMVQGTAEGIKVRKSFEIAHASAHRSMDFVAQLGHPVDPSIAQIWNVNSARGVDLGDMDDAMRTQHGFLNYADGAPSIWAPGALKFAGQ